MWPMGTFPCGPAIRSSSYASTRQRSGRCKGGGNESPCAGSGLAGHGEGEGIVSPVNLDRKDRVGTVAVLRRERVVESTRLFQDIPVIAGARYLTVLLHLARDEHRVFTRLDRFAGARTQLEPSLGIGLAAVDTQFEILLRPELHSCAGKDLAIE